MIQFKNPEDPNPAKKAVYEEAYNIYRQSYPALKPIWAGISSHKGT
jgi:sugar (pentulose or hexulose) kinase